MYYEVYVDDDIKLLQHSQIKSDLYQFTGALSWRLHPNITHQSLYSIVTSVCIQWSYILYLRTLTSCTRLCVQYQLQCARQKDLIPNWLASYQNPTRMVTQNSLISCRYNNDVYTYIRICKHICMYSSLCSSEDMSGQG